MRAQPQPVIPVTVLETKLYVPRPREGRVPRARLSERLDRGVGSKLVLVSAPAGFGKTTLLTEWLAGRSRDEELGSATWLSLDSGDNDPAHFWTYVIAGLRSLAPSMGATALELLHPPGATWIPPVLTCSATTGDGLDDVWAQVCRHRSTMEADGSFDARRADQQVSWMWSAVDDALLRSFRRRPDVRDLAAAAEAELRAGTITPGIAARRLLSTD